MNQTEETHESTRRDVLVKGSFLIPVIMSFSLAEISVAASGDYNESGDEYYHEGGGEY